MKKIKVIIVLISIIITAMFYGTDAKADGSNIDVDALAKAIARAMASAQATGGSVNIEGSSPFPLNVPEGLPRIDQPYLGPFPGKDKLPFNMNVQNSLAQTKSIYTEKDIDRNLNFGDNYKKLNDIRFRGFPVNPLPVEKATHFELREGYTADEIKSRGIPVREEEISLEQHYVNGEVVKDEAGKPVMVKGRKIIRQKFVPIVTATFFTDKNRQILQNDLELKALDENRKKVGGQYIFIVDKTYENWSQTKGNNIGGNAAAGASSSNGLYQTTISLPFFTWSKTDYKPGSDVQDQILICYGPENGVPADITEEIIAPPPIVTPTPAPVVEKPKEPEPKCDEMRIREQIKYYEDKCHECKTWCYDNFVSRTTLQKLNDELYICTGKAEYLNQARYHYRIARDNFTSGKDIEGHRAEANKLMEEADYYQSCSISILEGERAAVKFAQDKNLERYCTNFK